MLSGLLDYFMAISDCCRFDQWREFSPNSIDNIFGNQCTLTNPTQYVLIEMLGGAFKTAQNAFLADALQLSSTPKHSGRPCSFQNLAHAPN
jgi:hypothetical protein